MANEDDKQLPLFEFDDDHVSKMGAPKPKPEGESSPYSKYIIYVDESGDHSLTSIDDNYPVFVLAFCIFHKRHYSETIVPALEKFKFNYFGHDQVILHEHEIRKKKGSFSKLKSKEQEQNFQNELTGIIDSSNFILVSCTIDKRRLGKSGNSESNAYHTALGFCMETLDQFLQEKGQHKKKTHVVVECRGRKEDNELELEFRRVCDGSNRLGKKMNLEIIFSDKKAMSSGLQLADLVARPIGLSTLRPEQENRAFDVLKKKFYSGGGRPNAGKQFEGFGMKIYPP